MTSRKPAKPRAKRTTGPSKGFLAAVLLLLALGVWGILQLREDIKESQQQFQHLSQETRWERPSAQTGSKQEPEQESSELAEFSADTLEQGDTFVITLQKEQGRGAVAYVNGELVMFAEFQDAWLGIFGIHGKAQTGLYQVEVHLADGTQIPSALKVTKRDFPVTKLVFTEDLRETGYSETNFEQGLSADAKIDRLRSVWQQETPRAFFSEPFQAPVANPVNVGAYGNIRAGENYAFHHWGVDLQAAAGDPVYAANDGVAAFAQEGVYSYGTALVIDHGLGIYSEYLHLSELLVEEGALVRKGQLVARTGSTGYALAPHLHFDIKIRGAAVAPLRFIEAVQ